MTYTATCHTDGCENADVAIELVLAEPVDAVICGACGQPITDVEESS